MNFTFPLLLLACSLTLQSCAPQDDGMTGLEVYEAYDLPATLPSDPSAVRVKVSTSRQRVYVMEGTKLLLVMPVSVGMPSTPTPLGDFRVSDKDLRKRSRDVGFSYSGEKIRKTSLARKPTGWSFKGRPLPYWVEFKPNYGFHTGWVKHTPCTDGGIRMHRNLAPKFFELVAIGTPVSISVIQPEDAGLGSIPLPPDAGPLPDYQASDYLSDRFFTDHKMPSFD